MHYYEAMLVFDPATAGEWPDVEAEVNRLLERARATLVVCKKWDERRFAYEIKGHRRGLYVLVFFKSDGTGITDLRRDAQLSERILRVLILRNDNLTEEEMRTIEGDTGDGGRDRGDRDRGDRDRDRGDRDRGYPRRGDARPGPSTDHSEGPRPAAAGPATAAVPGDNAAPTAEPPASES